MGETTRGPSTTREIWPWQRSEPVDKRCTRRTWCCMPDLFSPPPLGRRSMRLPRTCRSTVSVSVFCRRSATVAVSVAIRIRPTYTNTKTLIAIQCNVTLRSVFVQRGLGSEPKTQVERGCHDGSASSSVCFSSESPRLTPNSTLVQVARGHLSNLSRAFVLDSVSACALLRAKMMLEDRYTGAWGRGPLGPRLTQGGRGRGWFWP